MERRHDSPPNSWRERESCIFSQLTSSRIPMTRAFLLAIAAFIVAPMPQVRKPVCAPDNAGLTLQPGFCALIVAESIGPSRHMVVLENGDVLVAVYGPRGGVRVLRDTTGDGKADVISSFGIGGGNGIAFAGEYLYFATDDAVVRWHWNIGQLTPNGGPDTVVSGLTNRRQNQRKSIVIGSDGQLYVNIGAPSNSCQVQDRAPESPGQDPCPILAFAGGIWRFRPPARGANPDRRPALCHRPAQRRGNRRGSGYRLAVRGPARARSARRQLAQALYRCGECGAAGGSRLPARGGRRLRLAVLLLRLAPPPKRAAAGVRRGWQDAGTVRLSAAACGCVSRPLGAGWHDVLQRPPFPAEVPRRAVHRVSRIVETRART